MGGVEGFVCRALCPEFVDGLGEDTAVDEGFGGGNG